MNFLTEGEIAACNLETADRKALQSAMRRGLKERIKFGSSCV